MFRLTGEKKDYFSVLRLVLSVLSLDDRTILSMSTNQLLEESVDVHTPFPIICKIIELI